MPHMTEDSASTTNKLSSEADQLLRKLEPGDIVLVSSRWVKRLNDLSSCAIRLANFTRKGPTKRYWTHSAMYLGDNQVIEAFPDPVGIGTHDIRKVYFGNPDYEIKVLRVKNRSAEERRRAAQECAVLGAGKTYDMIALMYFVLSYVTPAYLSFVLEDGFLGRLLNTVDKYFCSELVADGLLQAGIYTFDREPYQIMPAHFDNNLVFEEIGYLNMRNKGWILKLPEWLRRFGYYCSLVIWVLLPIAILGGIVLALIVFMRGKLAASIGKPRGGGRRG